MGVGVAVWWVWGLGLQFGGYGSWGCSLVGVMHFDFKLVSEPQTPWQVKKRLNMLKTSNPKPET